MRLAWVLAAALIPLVAGPVYPRGAAAHPRGAAAPQDSLEDLLRAAREKSAERREQLAAEIRSRMSRLELLGKPEPKSAFEAERAALSALGAEAAALMAPYVDPGDSPSEGAAFRADTTVEILAGLRARTATAALIDQAGKGTTPGRVRAVRALGYAPDADLVAPFLAALFADGPSVLRHEALRALARLGRISQGDTLARAFADEAEPILSTALEALAESRDAAAALRVRELLASPRAGRVALELFGYYRAVPSALGAGEARGLLALAARADTPEKARARVLAELPALAPPWSAEYRDALAPLTGSSDGELRTDALVCLARLGDKGSRKELMKECDELVEQNEHWTAALERRAAIEIRLGDHEGAIKDYRRLIELHQESGSDRRGESLAHVGLARAYALSGRLREAASTLERSPLSTLERRALANDPDFAELAKHPRYGKSLE